MLFRSPDGVAAPKAAAGVAPFGAGDGRPPAGRDGVEGLLFFGLLHADDFDFEAAEVGVVIFADAVSDVDVAAFDEAELRGALGEVPADGADGCDGHGGDG